VYSPLAQGVLSGKYKPGAKPPAGSRGATDKPQGAVSVADYLNDEVILAAEKLSNVAKYAGISLPHLALGWILSHKNVASAVVGASKPQQIEENVKASGIKLGAEILRNIEDILMQIKYTVKHNIVEMTNI
jgi:aryl-alcohol dehydrogenase-like predicted oxidoreductase